MNVLFVAGIAVIVRDAPSSIALYGDALGLPLEGDDYPSTDAIEGTRHFGVWPLHAAARSCFGSDEWPTDLPIPQAAIEFELESQEAVAAGVSELEASGHHMIHGAKEEPWGQTVARLQSPEGLLIGLSFAPWMH